MSRKVLVAYASKMGGTAGIAEAIGAELRDAGHQVDVREVSGVGTISEYDAVVLGSAIYVRRWRREAVKFLRKQADELSVRDVWLFHSGPVGPDKDQDQTMPRKVAQLVDRIGARPAKTFAGRLETATAKGFLARRLAAGALGGDSRDWPAIKAWAADIGAYLSSVDSTH